MARKRNLRVIAALLAAVMSVSCAAASEWMAEDGGLSLINVYVREERITYRQLADQRAGKLPVYAAPFDDAWRGAKGKAAVSTKEPFRLLGTAQNGSWTWIEYDISGREKRVGWIRTGIQPTEYETNRFPADGTLLHIETETDMTDDPRGGRRSIRKLRPGDEVIGLGRIETDDDSFNGWIYAETEIDGKPAWGFLPEGTARKIPSYTIEGDTLIYREGISAIGMTESAGSTEDPETGFYETVWRTFGPGEIHGDSIADWNALPGNVDRVIYPSTLKILGGEALCFGQWKEILLPAHPESCDTYAFYGLRAGKVIFPEEYTGPFFLDDHCTIDAYEAAEGNPVYQTADGVLYSADRKTLLRYPNGRKDEHFDVPAGVERIGPGAFSDDGMQLPLKTISLPMGLKEIGAGAFSGCGRLQSLTVPLTVTSLDPNAFVNCVSLERLSLPAGLTATVGGDWAEMADFSVYNGDNGATMAAAAARDEWKNPDNGFSIRMMLAPKDGEDCIPVYASAEGNEISRTRRPGEIVWIDRIQGNRVRIGESPKLWAEMENVVQIPGDTLFTETEISFEPGKWKTDLGAEAQPDQVDYYEADYFNGTVSFELVPMDSGGILTGQGKLELPFADCIFRRMDGDPAERFGVLYGEAGQVMILLAEAPDGTAGQRVPAGTQARVFESRNGWIHAETVSGRGWVSKAHFQEVPMN